MDSFWSVKYDINQKIKYIQDTQILRLKRNNMHDVSAQLLLETCEAVLKNALLALELISEDKFFTLGFGDFLYKHHDLIHFTLNSPRSAELGLDLNQDLTQDNLDTFFDQYDVEKRSSLAVILYNFWLYRYDRNKQSLKKITTNTSCQPELIAHIQKLKPFVLYTHSNQGFHKAILNLNPNYDETTPKQDCDFDTLKKLIDTIKLGLSQSIDDNQYFFRMAVIISLLTVLILSFALGLYVWMPALFAQLINNIVAWATLECIKGMSMSAILFSAFFYVWGQVLESAFNKVDLVSVQSSERIGDDNIPITKVSTNLFFNEQEAKLRTLFPANTLINNENDDDDESEDNASDTDSVSTIGII